MQINNSVTEVKLIIDDVTYIFREPRIVHLLHADHIDRCAAYPDFDLRIVPSDMPIVFRTVKREEYTEYEKIF